MAGVNGVVALQPAEAAQGGKHFHRVAAGKIGAAAGAGKERVADEEGIADLERDAAGGVAGGVGTEIVSEPRGRVSPSS